MGKELVQDGDFDSLFDFDSLECEIDQNIPIYLLFFERKHWGTVSGHRSFVLYEINDKTVNRLATTFPFHFETLKPLSLKTKYDFNYGVKRLNKRLERFYSRYN